MSRKRNNPRKNPWRRSGYTASMAHHDWIVKDSKGKVVATGLKDVHAARRWIKRRWILQEQARPKPERWYSDEHETLADMKYADWLRRSDWLRSRKNPAWERRRDEWGDLTYVAHGYVHVEKDEGRWVAWVAQGRGNRLYKLLIGEYRTLKQAKAGALKFHKARWRKNPQFEVRWIGVFHGGRSYGHPDWDNPEDQEEFQSLKAAESVFRRRIKGDRFYPNVDESARMYLWETDGERYPEYDGGGYVLGSEPDSVFVVGPRGGVVEEY